MYACGARPLRRALRTIGMTISAVHVPSLLPISIITSFVPGGALWISRLRSRISVAFSYIWPVRTMVTRVASIHSDKCAVTATMYKYQHSRLSRIGVKIRNLSP